MRHWEATAYRPFARVVLVTEEDAREVAALDPSLRVVTIPNGVDADHFAPRDAPRGDGILFTGALDAPVQRAGRAAAGEPDHAARAARAPGRAPDDRRPQPRAGGARARARRRRTSPDLRPYLWGAAVYACPMESGTGIKNKLLEAMAAGAPAVATSLACQGIDARHVAGRRQRRGVRRRARRAAADRRRAAKQADAAREYVRARHDWDAVAAAYLALYQDIA